MIKLPDKKVNLGQLNRELAAAGFKCSVARLSREKDSKGNIKRAKPYILVKTGDKKLSAQDRKAIKGIVKSHRAKPLPKLEPSETEKLKARVQALEDRVLGG